MTKTDQLKKALDERILILDGGAGTMIQAHKLSEADYRGERFADWKQDVQGNNDLLQLTRPDVIRGMHEAYLDAGADIIETNTFSSTTIAQADYGMEAFAREMNVVGAQLAREAADAAEKKDGRPRWVAGAIGPTNRTASISPDVNDPGARNVTFDELAEAYREAADGLIEGGVDMLLIETIFDTLNAKAALYGIGELFDARGEELPIMLSATITDQSGRTLSGQTATAFYHSIRHAKPLSVGLNCALGPDLMRQYVDELSGVAETYVSAYPNAGLPNAFGEYDETPESMAAHIKEWAESGMLNIVGGCCGTTPAHIAAFAEAVKGVPPRKVPESDGAMKLSGLEPFTLAG
ncbi:hypothetical protein GCM10007148_19070 [Parvularcula lutaonensis]|nr:homocysteine S-methyltransferase family protein [Parvularcula lutaonensis]GGY50454.1 hypothetical protein GCM10007148_19070 [Parvularcula lutaonensis]